MKGYEAKIKEAAAAYEEAAQQNQVESGPALYAKLAQLYNMSKQDDKALAAVNRALEQSRSAERSTSRRARSTSERRTRPRRSRPTRKR